AGPASWTAWAVGDVCLFHVRDGRLITTFPVTKSSDFGYTPPLYQSKALLPVPRAQVLRGELRSGDLLLFTTDALAQWMMMTTEPSQPPDWGRYLVVDRDEWRQEIENLRDRGAMINDDCTLLVLRPTIYDPGAHGDASRPAQAGPATPNRYDSASS